MKPPFSKKSSGLITRETVAELSNIGTKAGTTAVRTRGMSRSASGASANPGVSAFAPLYHDLLYNNISAYQTPRAKEQHNKLMRQIYDFDPIAGPAVDLYSELPWSTFDISGIKDPAIMHIYQDALSNLKLDQM